MEDRHDVTDEQWDLVAPLLCKEAAKTGRPRRNGRDMLNAVLWILVTGAPWRDLPDRFGPWRTGYEYFMQWRDAGTLDQVLESLQIKLDRDGAIDWTLFCIDGSNVRASRAAAGASKKASKHIPTSPRITRSAAPEAASVASCTSSLRAKACRLPSR